MLTNETLLRALEIQREQIKDSMDANDSHFSTYMQNELKRVNNEIEIIKSQ